MNTVLAHGLFGTKHIIILVVCLLLIVLGFIFSKKLSFEKIIKVMLGVGIVSEVIKVWNTRAGEQEWEQYSKLGGIRKERLTL